MAPPSVRQVNYLEYCSGDLDFDLDLQIDLCIIIW